MNTGSAQSFAQARNNGAIRAQAERVIEFLRRGKAAVFCGAGISFNSGIPVVGEIISTLLAHLGASDDEREALQASPIPFELFMQTLHECSDISTLLDIFDGGAPNNSHFLLASLMRDRLVNVVCTTNFDTLIERALADSGLNEGRDYLLYDNDKQLAQIEWLNPLPKLIKIHGSVKNKAEMAITLRQVAAQILTAGRSQVIDSLFKAGLHECVWVLGYSCSDVFDISPRIESYDAPLTKVVIVDHDRTRIGDEPIGAKAERNPFRAFAGRRLYLNTDGLVRETWKLMLKEPLPREKSSEPHRWRQLLRDWTSQRSVDRGATMSALLFAAGHPKPALVRLKGAGRDEARTLERLVYLINEGAGEGEAGHYDASIRVLRRALAIALALEHPMAIAQVLANIAMAFLNKGHYSTALRISFEARKNAEVAGDLRSVGACDDTISSCYRELGNVSEAIRYGKRALQNFNESGEANFGATVLGNLALCHERLGERESALAAHIEAYEKSRAVNRIAASEVHVGNILRLARDLGREDIMAKYEAVFVSNVSDHGRAINLANTANHVLRSGQAERALPLYNEAIELMRLCGDDYGFALQSRNRGFALMALQRFEDATKDFQQSARGFAEIGLPSEQVEALLMNARALENRGDLVQPCAALEEALALIHSGSYDGPRLASPIETVIRRMKKALAKEAGRRATDKSG